MTDAHTSRAHATLSPSSASRWMACPASVRLSEGIPNTSSIFAAEGTACHELAALCLQQEMDPTTFIDEWVDIETGKIASMDEAPDDEMRFFRVTEEMAEAAGMYVDHVRSLVAGNAVLSVEERVSMEHIHSGIFGTADAIVFDPDTRHLSVVDLKFGKGVAVDAFENPQILLYAAGAARRYHNAKIETLTVWIVQPRAPHALGPIRSHEIDILSLFEFEDELEKLAKRTEDPAAPAKAGSHCRFCPAQPVCPTVRSARLSAAADEFGEIGAPVVLAAPEKLSDEKLAAVLKEADAIGTWVKAVQEYAHAQACAGRMPTGFKLVAKRAVRKWVNEAEAEIHLRELGVGDDDLYITKFKSPAQLEKVFPGKNKKEREQAMAELVKKESSGTNLVPSEDPRPAVVTDAASEFGAV